MSGGAAVFRLPRGRDLTFGKHKHVRREEGVSESGGGNKVLTETELKKTRHVLSRCLKVTGNDTPSRQSAAYQRVCERARAGRRARARAKEKSRATDSI